MFKFFKININKYITKVITFFFYESNFKSNNNLLLKKQFKIKKPLIFIFPKHKSKYVNFFYKNNFYLHNFYINLRKKNILIYKNKFNSYLIYITYIVLIIYLL